MAGNLRKRAEEFDAPEPKPKRGKKPNGSCVQCDGSGLVPVCYVFPRGTVIIVDATCDCDDGGWLREGEWYGRLLSLNQARDMGIAPTGELSKHDHWIYQQRRYYELIEDQKGAERLEAILQAHADKKLGAWWKQHLGSLPVEAPVARVLFGATRGLFRNEPKPPPAKRETLSETAARLAQQNGATK